MKLLAPALFAATLLAGCATSYQSDGFSGGYTETWLAEDAVRVTFNGNGYTRSGRAADFSLLRVAEIAMQKGYPYFVLVEESSEVSTSTTPKNYQVTGFGNSATITEMGGWTISKPSTTNTAKFLKTKPADYAVVVYSASFICNAMAEKYDLDLANGEC